MVTDISLTPTGSQFQIELRNGLKIPARSWGAPNDCKAVAILVHGLGAHSGWCEAFARQLKVRRIFAVSFDQAGFGKRREEAVFSYHRWIDDIVAVFDYIKEIYPNKPVYLIGNSMGGLLSLVAVQYIHPDGLVLLSPGLDGHPKTFNLGYRLFNVIKAYFQPEALVRLPYDATLITRDIAVQTWLKNDPDGHFDIKAKYLLELLKLSNAVKKRKETLRVPLLVLTSGQDQVVNNVINEAFFNNLSAPTKRHKQFTEAWHDLMFDPLVDEVSEEIVYWMSEHTVEKLITGSN